MMMIIQPEKPYQFWWRPFFLVITWFWQKNRLNLIETDENLAQVCLLLFPASKKALFLRIPGYAPALLH